MNRFHCSIKFVKFLVKICASIFTVFMHFPLKSVINVMLASQNGWSSSSSSNFWGKLEKDGVLFQFSSVQSLSGIDSLRPPVNHHARPPCPSQRSRGSSNSCPSGWCDIHPSYPLWVASSSCPQSSGIRVFSVVDSFPVR